ncbi:bifunctional diguanylate cyclase/phosphodiesterase [Kineosporia sp. A_224]|uniref:putative bifunctional diguanylate cyclase/phosphodiesterase n=1 Tax=Kineosporia sp. A_224 TaxID=1962180 RepID=UPI000B4BF10E|nr:bifunctional diguanylate cyclase/phosphodiesterase [Kineosporia sp. A_224]
MSEEGFGDRTVTRTARLLFEAAEALVPGAALEAVVETPVPGGPWAHVCRVGRGGPVSVVLVDLEDVPAPARTVLASGRPVLEAGGRLRDEHVVAAPLRRDGRVHGVLVARKPFPGNGFGHLDAAALASLGRSHGLALENALLVERLRHEASHDTLTGLPNRRGLQDGIEHALAERARTGCDVAALVLGIDGFRDVNAALGHRSGDALLRHVADAVLAALPLGAQVARSAGDEFAVLLTGVLPADRAESLADRLRAAAATPLVVDGVEVQARASVGIAVAHTDLDDPRSLLGTADLALAQAKAQARGVVSRVAVNPERRPGAGPSSGSPSASPSGPTGAGTTPAGRESMATLAELRRALRGEPGAGEVVAHLQPQADAGTGRVLGAEALVRWVHPVRGLLGPADFLALADRHGLMLDLTEVVLDRAVHAAALYRADGHDLAVSVNLSARTLVAQWLVPTVTSALERHGVPASALTLEITEDSMIADPEHAVALLDSLRDIGVRLSVDDFGTGYSSLSYLRRLPVDEVKIDKSFLAAGERAADAGADLVIARSIVDLARNLGLETVAEGVEDDTTWERLAGLGCHVVQGFGLARPMPVDQLRTWLAGYRADRAGGTRRPAAGRAVPAVRRPVDDVRLPA